MTDRWRDRAACRDAVNLPGDWTVFPEDLFSPGSAEYRARVDEVRQAFCWTCPVRAECLRDGMLEDYGMWGGLTPEDRKTVTQLDCHCGDPIDPKDMLSNGRRHFCPIHVPLVFDRSSKVGT